MKVKSVSEILIYPPDRIVGDLWIVRNWVTKRNYKVSSPTLAILLYCKIPHTVGDILDFFYEKYGIKNELIHLGLKKLMATDLLLEVKQEMDGSNEVFGLEFDNWYKHNWYMALLYHLVSYDYPFIEDYVAKQRMINYSSQEIDSNRYKEYNSQVSYDIPKATEVKIRETNTSKQKCVNFADLLTMASLGYTRVGSLRVYWNGDPLILRTSPSGGSRHPTETYIVAINVEGLESGWYHISVKDSKLEQIKIGGTDPDDLRLLFPTTYVRPDFHVDLILIFTSIFERNMYRYREPRTFRTIHMDVGHLAATTEIICEKLGYKYLVQYSANDEGIEKFLGLSPLKEGYMASMAIGN
ncbi:MULTISPECIES: SagB/ThcOx family dehydrogenase [Thermoplasmatales]|jgi:SagB-type dehydrogenase family enzyme|uniref:Nitroreductase domain-containing protein n=3 Tax=Thermoplasmatales TaxID=2301 RepID=Q9HL60_THEAC|nr:MULTISPECIES: SagB/ThcOx family dehydrogenase [Thermoplasmatales]MCI2413102.1 SagB/ThcOx family dehydrogenase [Cuniculiplasma sp.]CAC11515.1 conserved hypothetical protein [Thermoplasma acidophilum]NOL60251.1 SagB/ThcOx family dehydrogenase [Ferroplasma acidiphilum]WMT45210.1 MAG: SagB/ThcOx family dehydrogenase [Cuniculiplasma divulgatum]WMT53355.1 MAG: SagB/ThcOx family dehydrogenase [Ferroplasma acidiphilum]